MKYYLNCSEILETDKELLREITNKISAKFDSTCQNGIDLNSDLWFYKFQLPPLTLQEMIVTNLCIHLAEN